MYRHWWVVVAAACPEVPEVPEVTNRQGPAGPAGRVAPWVPSDRRLYRLPRRGRLAPGVPPRQEGRAGQADPWFPADKAKVPVELQAEHREKSQLPGLVQSDSRRRHSYIRG